jgi:hypothetical protein
VRGAPDAARAPSAEDPGMRFSSRIENGRVLCGEKGVWMDIENCYHCPAFQTIKESGSQQTLVCKTALDYGLWSPLHSAPGFRV